MKSEYDGSIAEFIVLNVCGDKAGREAISAVLRAEGYQVIEASNGEAALQVVAQANAPALVLATVTLPDMDGFTLCRRLKQDPATAFMPVMLRSAAHTSSADYVRGLETGADAYLREPAPTEELAATVWALLRTARAKTALRRARDELELRVAERTEALRAEVQERRQAEARAQQQAAQARALAQAAAVLGQLDLDTVMVAIYHTVNRALNVPVLTISLYNERKEQFELAFAAGLPNGVLEAMQPAPRAVTVQPDGDSNEPVITPDVQALTDLPNADLYRELDIRTTVNVNLLYKGELVGRLNIGTVGAVRHFSEDELVLLRGFTELAAVALNNARLYEEVKQGREQLARLNRRLAQAEEEERKRLAQELHDSAGQLATALQMNLVMLRHSAPDEAFQEQIAEAESLSGLLYEEIRRVSHSLRPPHLQVLGLHGALAALCRQFDESGGLKVTYEGEEVAEMAEATRIALYRVAQEALTNVARHAQATEAWVSLGCDGDVVSVVVEDNGSGFDLETTMAEGGGMGLQSMRERVALLDGSLEIEPRAGGGTRLEARCAIDLMGDVRAGAG